ncbi:hypothetical protein, partial [Streptomyces sp. CB02923]|uniref:hypothetical protein n=1 Tax=Streptomyces sp. CB02923 TaxID=1718985 RepID=UPI003FCEEAFA
MEHKPVPLKPGAATMEPRTIPVEFRTTPIEPHTTPIAPRRPVTIEPHTIPIKPHPISQESGITRMKGILSRRKHHPADRKRTLPNREHPLVHP